MRYALSRDPITLVTSVVAILIFVSVAIGADVIAPLDPLQQDLRHRLVAPVWLGGEGGYLLGSDQLGRDVLSRVIHGSRASLAVGATAVLIGGLIGILLGLIAGYARRAWDDVIMVFADIQLAFPLILLAISIIAVLGPSFVNLVIVVGLSGWVTYARIARAQVFSLKERDFVEAIRSIGGDHVRILFRHILPNMTSALIVIATLDLARTILLESTLSFLGLGVQPPTPSWGGMLGEGRQYLGTAWWIAVFPGLALMAVALGVGRLGDWVRDALDPSLRT